MSVIEEVSVLLREGYDVELGDFTDRLDEFAANHNNVILRVESWTNWEDQGASANLMAVGEREQTYEENLRQQLNEVSASIMRVREQKEMVESLSFAKLDVAAHEDTLRSLRNKRGELIEQLKELEAN